MRPAPLTDACITRMIRRILAAPSTSSDSLLVFADALMEASAETDDTIAVSLLSSHAESVRRMAPWFAGQRIMATTIGADTIPQPCRLPPCALAQDGREKGNKVPVGRFYSASVPLEPNECGMAISTAYKHRGRTRFSVSFAIGKAAARSLGWSRGDLLGIHYRDGLWVIARATPGWTLSYRAGSESFHCRVVASKLGLLRHPTQPRPQEVCAHEIKGNELLICPPVWGEAAP